MSNKKEKSVIQKFIEVFLTILLIAMTVLTFYQVVLRYAFNKAPSWSEELVRFIFVWSSFLAAAVGIREKSHLGIDALTHYLPDSVNKILQYISYILMIVFGGVLLYAGAPVVLLTHDQPSPALGIPMSYVYIALPLMGILIIYYSVIEIVKLAKSKEEGNC